MRKLVLTRNMKSKVFEYIVPAKRISNEELIEAAADLAQGLEQITELRELYYCLKNERLPCALIDGLPECGGNPMALEVLAIGMASLLGEPFQYAEQNGGKINAELTPKDAFRGQNNTGEGDGAFGWHTDDAVLAREFRAEWIQLFCIANSAAVATRVAMLDELVANLDNEAIDILSQSRFLFDVPKSFQLTRSAKPKERPVLSWYEATCEIAFSSYGCRAQSGDDKSRQAIEKVSSTADAVVEDVMLQPGQILVFSNMAALHGRGAISTGHRLLYRTLVKRDLNALRQFSGSTGNVFKCTQFI